jgi:hypothetical protein
MNLYEEQALKAIEKYGVVEARRQAINFRDMNSQGTASFAFHNAVVAAIRRFETVGFELPGHDKPRGILENTRGNTSPDDPE